MSDTDIVNHTDVNDDMNTDLPESLAPMLKSPTVFEWPYVNSSAWPTLNPGIVNQTDVTFDMDTYPPENSAPMIDSDLMVLDWEDILYRRPGYCGGDLHDMMDMDRFDPDVWKRMDYAHSRMDGGETRGVDTADRVNMCRTVAQDERWSDTDDNSDTDSIAEWENNTGDDACAWEFRNAPGNIPPGLIQNPPTDII